MDHREEAGLVQTLDQLVGELLPTEEVAGVAFLKGAQALLRGHRIRLSNVRASKYGGSVPRLLRGVIVLSASLTILTPTAATAEQRRPEWTSLYHGPHTGLDQPYALAVS